MNPTIMFFIGVSIFILGIIFTLLNKFVFSSKKVLIIYKIFTIVGIILMLPYNICLLMPEKQNQTTYNLASVDGKYISTNSDNITVYILNEDKITPKTIDYELVSIYSDTMPSLIETTTKKTFLFFYVKTSESYSLYVQ